LTKACLLCIEPEDSLHYKKFKTDLSNETIDIEYSIQIYIVHQYLCSCKSKIRMEEDCTLWSSAASNTPWFLELIPDICEELSLVIYDELHALLSSIDVSIYFNVLM
jgi:hypothetical protein